MTRTNAYKTTIASLFVLFTHPAISAVSDVVSATDDIVFRAATPKISLTVNGFSNLPAGDLADNTQVGDWTVKTQDGKAARLAVSFGTNHLPVAGEGKDTVSANLTSEKGKPLNVHLKQSTGMNVETQSEQGAKWLVSAEDAVEMKGSIRAYQNQKVEADSFAFTMNAAIYNV